MQHRVTMRDIAEKVGMSRATVSAVLGNKEHCYASEKTKELIRKTAVSMGYSMNLLARGLKSGKTYTIGLVEDAMQHEIRGQEVVSLTNLLGERNYRLYVSYYKGETSLLRAACDDLISRGCDALIVSGGKLSQDMYRIVTEITNRVVFFSFSDSSLPREQTVFFDYASGTREALEHLFALGHRNIWMLGHVWNGFASDLRSVTFRDFLRKHHQNADNRILILEKDAVLPVPDMRDFFRKNPSCTAFFCVNDLQAMQLIQVCARLGIRTPEDISVIGFDDITASRYYTPALTTVHPQIESGTRSGVQLLMNLLENESNAPCRHIYSRLILRESTAIPRSGDLKL